MKIKTKRICKIHNWSEYNRSLRQRGSLTFWFSEELLEQWLNSQSSGRRGASQKYTRAAIVCCLSLQALYRLPLRQSVGFLSSVFELLKLKLPVPDPSTLCRRRASLDFEIPVERLERARDVVVDSTGVKVYGAGEWLAKKHGPQGRRGWLKLHIGIDAETQEIVASLVSTSRLHDGSALPDLLEQIEEPLEKVIGDKAYDWFSCHQLIGSYQAQPVIPPRKNAKIRQRKGSDPPLSRDEILRRIREVGQRQWKEESGYHRRSLVETAMFRFKRIFGGSLKTRLFDSQAHDLFIRCHLLNQMLTLGRPQTYLVEKAA